MRLARTPEARWLLAAAAAPGAPAPPAALDAARVGHAAAVHRLASRAGSRLAAAGAAGHPLAAPLVRAWRTTLGDHALVEDALAGLGARAAAAGLPLVALKGADLARRVYAAGERPSNDVDLLVPPARVEDAACLLAAAGFDPDHPDPAFAHAHWFATTFRHRERPRLQVDLHWGLGGAGRTRWDADALVARSEPLPALAGLRRLAAEDLAAHLALHAVAFHGAAGRWLWWLDLLLLDRWDGAARARAAEVGGRVAFEAAGLRVADLFGADAPAAGPRARAIARLGAALEDRDTGRAGRWAVAALAVDRPRDLLRAAAAVLRRR